MKKKKLYVLVGIQRCQGLMPDFELYNLLEDFPGHPKNSTVSQATLEELGIWQGSLIKEGV